MTRRPVLSPPPTSDAPGGSDYRHTGGVSPAPLPPIDGRPPTGGAAPEGRRGGDPLAWLDERAAAREAAGLRRRLRVRESADDPLVDLSGNDYLGLSRHPEVVAAAATAAAVWGAGSTGSRLVSGTTRLHDRLERALARFVGTPAALVFSSGYLANLAAVTALAGRGDLIVAETLNHASLIDACRLSGARIVVTPHRDPGSVAKVLADRDEERALVVTDAVFSVDGDLAPLAELHRAARRHGAVLLVDDAHGLGVVGEAGRGAAHDAGVAGQPDVVVTATLSKSLAGQGGAVLGSASVVAHLVDAARPFIFDTGLAPPSAGAALAALDLLAARPELPARVRAAADRIEATARRHGFAPPPSQCAVVAVPIGAAEDALAAAATCTAHGVRVGCFRPPSTPDPVSRLRVTARADLTEDAFTRLDAALAAVAASLGAAHPALRSSGVG